MKNLTEVVNEHAHEARQRHNRQVILNKMQRCTQATQPHFYKTGMTLNLTEIPLKCQNLLQIFYESALAAELPPATKAQMLAYVRFPLTIFSFLLHQKGLFLCGLPMPINQLQHRVLPRDLLSRAHSKAKCNVGHLD